MRGRETPPAGSFGSSSCPSSSSVVSLAPAKIPDDSGAAGFLAPAHGNGGFPGRSPAGGVRSRPRHRLWLWRRPRGAGEATGSRAGHRHPAGTLVWARGRIFPSSANRLTKLVDCRARIADRQLDALQPVRGPVRASGARKAVVSCQFPVPGRGYSPRSGRAKPRTCASDGRFAGWVNRTASSHGLARVGAGKRRLRGLRTARAPWRRSARDSPSPLQRALSRPGRLRRPEAGVRPGPWPRLGRPPRPPLAPPPARQPFGLAGRGRGKGRRWVGAPRYPGLKAGSNPRRVAAGPPAAGQPR